MREYYNNAMDYYSLPVHPKGRGTLFKPKPMWKSRNPNSTQKRSDFRNQKQQPQQQTGVDPPRLNDLRRQNRLKTRKFFPKKVWRAPYAPRNTSSFIMRAKDLGGIASLVSPNPATPAVLATPDMSKAPVYKEGITDEVSKEWGVNGYGSMNGFIRLRPWEGGRDGESSDSDSEVDQESSATTTTTARESNHHHHGAAESVQQLETKLDHDLNRFEMVYPTEAAPNLVETRMEDQENHIAHLEEENLTLKERLYVMEQELEELRRRLSTQEDLDSMDEQQAEVCCDSEKSGGDVSCCANRNNNMNNDNN